MTRLILLQELLLLAQQPLTSGCFLRGLRSLTILAFLAGFLSSRSLSPSPLEELAEALLSNLHGGTSLRAAPRRRSPEASRAGAAVLPLTALRGVAFHEHGSLCSASWTFGALGAPGLSSKLPPHLPPILTPAWGLNPPPSCSLSRTEQPRPPQEPSVPSRTLSCCLTPFQGSEPRTAPAAQHSQIQGCTFPNPGDPTHAVSISQCSHSPRTAPSYGAAGQSPARPLLTLQPRHHPLLQG